MMPLAILELDILYVFIVRVQACKKLDMMTESTFLVKSPFNTFTSHSNVSFVSHS